VKPAGQPFVERNGTGVALGTAVAVGVAVGSLLAVAVGVGVGLSVADGDAVGVAVGSAAVRMLAGFGEPVAAKAKPDIASAVPRPHSAALRIVATIWETSSGACAYG
jgi:hypothetical protein